MLNGSAAPGRPWLDLTYQLLGSGFGVMPVVLVAYLLYRSGEGLRTIGADLRRPRFDLSGARSSPPASAASAWRSTWSRTPWAST